MTQNLNYDARLLNQLNLLLKLDHIWSKTEWFSTIFVKKTEKGSGNFLTLIYLHAKKTRN
jgi:hypothetical protein